MERASIFHSTRSGPQLGAIPILVVLATVSVCQNRVFNVMGQGGSEGPCDWKLSDEKLSVVSHAQAGNERCSLTLRGKGVRPKQKAEYFPQTNLSLGCPDLSLNLNDGTKVRTEWSRNDGSSRCYLYVQREDDLSILKFASGGQIVE